jgi:carnosine N-methyltransferase
MKLFQAKNIINYLRIIHRILAPGGVWINMGEGNFVLLSEFTLLTPMSGPLLWHFENNTTNDPSIELDLEEVKDLARKIGFVISVSLYNESGHVTLTLTIGY